MVLMQSAQPNGKLERVKELQRLAAQEVVTSSCGLVVVLSRLATRSNICATL